MGIEKDIPDKVCACCAQTVSKVSPMKSGDPVLAIIEGKWDSCGIEGDNIILCKICYESIARS